jgi:hypothetical protein
MQQQIMHFLIFFPVFPWKFDFLVSFFRKTEYNHYDVFFCAAEIMHGMKGTDAYKRRIHA